jgi:hypothetical protein
MSRDPLSTFSATCSFRVISPWLVLWLFERCRHSKPGTKMKDGGGVHLRDPGFHDTKDKFDLPHGRFLVVVKGHDQALAFGQVVDRIGQKVPHLPIQVARQRIVVGATRYQIQLIFV